MLNCGSKLFMVAMYLPISKLTFVMQQLVKTTNTLQCTKISLTKLKKKALQKSLTKCAKLVKSKLVMKLVTLH